MEKKIEIEENEVAELVKGKRVHTSLNLKAVNVDTLSEIAKDMNLTKTTIIDSALEIAIREYTKTTLIDQMLSETNGYWFERNINRVKEILTPEETKRMTAYQKAYLYKALKDPQDRQRVFEALGLNADLDEIDLVNKVLEKCRRLKDGQVVGFKFPQMANDFRTNLSNLQVKYLQLIIGIDATEKLRKLIPEKFPKNEVFKEESTSADPQKSFSESTMNPALPTVLLAAQISKATWKALPDSLKKKVHDAVKLGEIDLARKLVANISDASEAIDLFPQIAQENA